MFLANNRPSDNNALRNTAPQHSLHLHENDPHGFITTIFDFPLSPSFSSHIRTQLTPNMAVEWLTRKQRIREGSTLETSGKARQIKWRNIK